MRPDPRVLLADIDRAGADIARFTEGMDSATYTGDALTQAAVKRKFEISVKYFSQQFPLGSIVASYTGAIEH